MQINNSSSITFKGKTYDKRTINEFSAILENNLAAKSIAKDEVVAISMKRSYWIVIAMYTFHRLGIPYLIINSTFPNERVKYMLETGNINHIISDDIIKQRYVGYDVISVDHLEMGDEKIQPLGSDIMYLAFTSGTTGKPKAIAVSSEGFEEFAKSFIESGALDGVSRNVCMTDFSFDIIYCETLIPLSKGMNVVIADEDDNSNVKRRCALIQDNHIDFIQCTPSALAMMKMLDEKMDFLDGVKTLLLGGEALPDSLLKSLNLKKNLRVLNYYGPTETTVWATYSDLTGKNVVNIGKPLSNTTVYILDNNAKPVPDGQQGEICIGGKSLAQGYYHNEETTSKAFIMYNGERVYRTGDLGYIENGTIFCCGRKDFQVKVRGHRIETDEIDSQMMQMDGIKSSVTTTYQTESGTELISFYISENKIDESILRKNLLKFLPDYMIPTTIVWKENFSYTSNGKTDRIEMVNAYLAECAQMEAKKSESISSGDEIFDEILKFLQGKNLFSLVNIKSEMKFKEIGLDSVEYVSLVVYFEDKYDFEFEDDYLIADAFETLGEFVNYIRSFT